MATPILPYIKEHDSISFLDLPCEIRVEIYHWVYISSQVQLPRLGPWYAIPQCRTHIVQAVVGKEQRKAPDDDAASSVFSGNPVEQHKPARLLSPHRPLCYFHSGLLQSCRLIYAEARMIPFSENEFSYTNWFASGLSSALAFTRALVPWQRAELCYLRLEVHAQDLLYDNANYVDWVQLCGHLSGLRGLRLTVNMVGGMAWSAVGKGFGDMRVGGVLARKKAIEDARELLCERQLWIKNGLGKLRALQQVEVELGDAGWTDKEKLEWCAKLRELLVASNEATEVIVVCVRKLASG
ncbi:unnamed protein product [Discula destructiva]